MKQLSSLVLSLSFLFHSPVFAEAETPSCTFENNLFYSKIRKDDSNPKGCIEDSSQKKNTLSKGIAEINSKLISNNLSGCSTLLSKESVVKTKESCRKITRCSDEIVQFSSVSSDEIYCSLNTIKFNYDKAKFVYSTNQFFNKVEPQILATENIESILQKLGIDNKEIFKCPKVGSEKACSQEVSGLEEDYVKRVLNEVVLNSLKGQGKPTDKESRMRTRATRNSAARAQTYLNRLSFVANISENASTSSPLNVEIYNDEAKAKVQRTLLEVELSVELKKLGIDFYDEKKKYDQMFSDSSVPYKDELEKYKTLYLKIYNEAAKSKCSTSIYNMKYVCKEIAKTFKNVKDINQKDILLSYASDLSFKDKKAKTPTDEYVLNLGILNSVGNNEKFDFNQFLKVYDYSNACIDEFGQDAIEGSVGSLNAKTRFSQIISQRTEAIRSVAESSVSKTTNLMKDITNDIENSDDNDLKRISKSARILTGANVNTQIESNNSFKKMIEPIGTNNLEKLSQVNTSDKIISEIAPNIENKNIQALPRTSLPTTVPSIGQNEFNSILDDRNQPNTPNQSVMKRISELEEREKALKKKTDDKVATSAESDEMKQLRMQIEELKGQLAKSNNMDALGNKMVVAKDGAASTATATAKYPAATNLPGTASAIVSKKDSREVGSERENYSANVPRSNYSDNGSVGSPDMRAPASVGGGKSAIGSMGKGGSATAFGMALTRSGELTEDLSKIADNPKEAELFILAEKSNGQPFIIRENGLLVQVVVEKDTSGKMLLENGKPKLRKIKLSKEKEALVAREFNVVREAKTVRDTVRLQDLRKTTEDAVK